METTNFSYPQWMKRMMGTSEGTQRIEEITARYSHLLFSAGPILAHVNLDEIAYIGSVLANLPSSPEVCLAPYSFADLFLDGEPALQGTFNRLPFPMQCKVLDTAREYAKADPPYAMIALDWESGSVQLLALSSQKNNLSSLSLAFLTDPLTETMIDERHEPQKAHLLSKAKQLLQSETSEKQVGVYAVTCSEELFVDNVFGFNLDCPFSIVLGEKKDSWERNIPKHITEADEACANTERKYEKCPLT